MRLFIACIVVLAATPLLADDMTDKQQAAYDRVFPLIQEQVEGNPGKFLSECIVNEASSRELTKMGLGTVDEPDQKVLETASTIMKRPEIMSCLTDKLSQ